MKTNDGVTNKIRGTAPSQLHPPLPASVEDCSFATLSLPSLPLQQLHSHNPYWPPQVPWHTMPDSPSSVGISPKGMWGSHPRNAFRRQLWHLDQRPPRASPNSPETVNATIWHQ